MTAVDASALPQPVGGDEPGPAGWELLLERLAHPAALTDARGDLQRVSPAFARRLGRAIGELPGTPLAALSPGLAAASRQELLGQTGPSLLCGPFAPGGLPLRLSRLESAAGAHAWRGLLLELPGPRLELRAFESLCGEHGGERALLHLQLQHLDLVLGKLGLEAGEQLLEALAHRLQACLPASALFCREAGDRFLVLLPGSWTPERISAVVEDLLVVLEQPLTLREHVLEPGFHVGVARSPDDGRDFARLHRAATEALALTHRQPVQACRLAEPPETGRLMRERLAGPLAIALEQGGLELAFQPILDLEHGPLVGAEVLCRWEDPVLGRQCPSDFINVAEATGQISGLGRWVIDSALATLHRWDRAGHRLDWIGFNLSVLQLEEAGGLDVLTEAVERHGLQPARVMLELSEADVIALGSQAADQLIALHRQGFRLAMDDFGSGYAGLQRLSQLPFDQVKVNRSLIAAIDYDPMQQAMMMALVNTAARHGFALVAVGIERSRQLQMLQSLGCRLGQGFHLVPPLSQMEIEAEMRRRREASGRTGEF